LLWGRGSGCYPLDHKALPPVRRGRGRGSAVRAAPVACGPVWPEDGIYVDPRVGGLGDGPRGLHSLARHGAPVNVSTARAFTEQTVVGAFSGTGPRPSGMRQDVILMVPCVGCLGGGKNDPSLGRVGLGGRAVLAGLPPPATPRELSAALPLAAHPSGYAQPGRTVTPLVCFMVSVFYVKAQTVPDSCWCPCCGRSGCPCCGRAGCSCRAVSAHPDRFRSSGDPAPEAAWNAVSI